MASRGAFVCAVMLAGCGRIGFPNGGSGDDIPDGRASDASGDSGPPLSCTTTHPSALLCSGFEQPGMGEWEYTVIDQGSVTTSTARAYRGTQSLEIRTTDADAYKSARWGKNSVFDALDAGDLYFREYVWLDSSTVVTDQLSILVVGNGAPPYPSSNVMLVPGQLHAGTGAMSITTPYEYPRDKWTCLTMHIAVGPDGGIEVFVDGARVLSGNNFDSRVAGGYTNVDVGVHYATPMQTASRMWIDEVVVDTAPIGCN